MVKYTGMYPALSEITKLNISSGTVVETWLSDTIFLVSLPLMVCHETWVSVRLIKKLPPLPAIKKTPYKTIKISYSGFGECITFI